MTTQNTSTGKLSPPLHGGHVYEQTAKKAFADLRTCTWVIANMYVWGSVKSYFVEGLLKVIDSPVFR